ncbi:ABC-three component system middle component 2 [Paenibacillus sp. FSL R7-0026]|uniref:ABC-three component system middle component 2 n=1 Tax=Paenibacillus sp. FSL R7-0026 TaxID=2921668 RepID=UPI0030FB50EC
MIEELNLVNRDLILNSIRILTLISEFESKKSFCMSLNRIMLYDFFMKFPRTMIPAKEKNEEKKDFNEFYSYFHWQPDREEYNLYLSYLISKDLIERKIIKNDFCFHINEKGKEVLGKFKSSYSNELTILAKYIKHNISKLSDSKVEGMIMESLDGIHNE